MEKRKRGDLAQLSLFMIFSMLILVGGIVWFTIIQVAQQEADNIPQDIKPVTTFISDCLKIATDSTLRQVGTTGGYVNIPQHIHANPAAYLQSKPFASLRQPYWWHDGIEAVPPLDFIQQQVRDETEQKTLTCLNNFEAFSSQYDIMQHSTPTVEVSFNEEDTSATLWFDLTIATKDNSTVFSEDEFRATLPIQFKHIYELATLIMDRQLKDYFVEKKTLDLMSMAPQDIPLTEVELSCDQLRWNANEVQGRIQELLFANIPFIKIAGTPFSTSQYVPNPFGKETYKDSYFNAHYIWDLGSKPSENLRVGFSYEPSWPMIFNVRPQDNGIMESGMQQGSGLASMLCLQIAKFTYDLAFPVVVSIVDETNMMEPYVFSYAFAASIDHNQPLRENRGFELFEVEEEPTSHEYCGQQDREFTVYTKDQLSLEDIKDVNITFVCGRYVCSSGHTDWLGLGAAAGLSARYPSCNNAIIRAHKEGYLPAEKFIQTDDDGSAEILFLVPTIKISSLKLIKHPSYIPSQEELLLSSESASFSLKAKDIEFERSGFYPLEDGQLELLRGQHAYDVSVRLIRNEEIIGGYEGKWTVDAQEGMDSLTIHVLESQHADDTERYTYLANLLSHSSQLPQPELST